MIELRFHRELYDGFAIDEAVKAFAELASSELADDDRTWVVRMSALPAAAAEGIDEPTLADELANYALGLTIERRGAGAGPEGGGAR